MSEVFPGNNDVKLVYAAAFMKGDPGKSVTTDQLLAALTTAIDVRATLAAAAVTRTVVAAVSHTRKWHSADAAGVGPPGPTDLVMAQGGKPSPFTPAAAEALRRATVAAYAAGRPTCTPTDLLRALLDDPGSRATELLTYCRVDIAALREALDSGQLPTVADGADPDLRRVRDALIGRIRYERKGWRNWLISLFLRSRPNWAAQPVLWVMAEAHALADQRGRPRRGTDDVLLAILATYEVAQEYPHLTESARDQYGGGQILADLGVRYRDAYQVAQDTDLGADPKPLRSIVSELPESTTALLRTILTGPDNRAGRLLSALGIDPRLPT
jgi:hypothetical protein